ncbi:PHD finger motif containing protein [Oryctes borbonicus]|uniref:PHD finger motif containing protein n=1 Tax=Oryctes borbonicus TaxID=1629725 RepID=A0A0T6AVL5_9SCAR|nr:PHD finger motif containing protein [Oryctes borbonicus]
MGRSKFPGKPSKHVNRTRINVLCTPLDTTVGDTNNIVTVKIGDSKQSNNAGETSQDEKKSENVDKQINKRIPRKKQRTRLVNKRTALKRNGMLPSVSSKLTNINQVPRRTRSAVTGRRSIRNFSNIRKVPKPKHSVSPAKESNNLVGKFVLPSRSVHSSRVIKPNKRFINVESNEARAFKKRASNKRLCIRETEDKCPPDKNSAKESADNETNDISSVHSKGKVVLRQARLQLHTQSTSSGPEGPFSSNISNTVSPPGTVTCGVCGAVRFYRFVKQARKFNIYSCESCRKFISKMIKRHQSNLTALVCHKGQGMCHVPPIVRSQQWKLFRCAYRARCPACWLKMCLRSFQMPTALKNSLAQLLPKNMQTCDSLFTNPLSLLSWQSNVDTVTDKLSVSVNGETSQESNIRRRPVRLKAVKRDTKPIVNIPVSEIKRQKVDLKGPRVKHVCRSASIVLGQPIATFPIDNTKKNIDNEEKIESKKVIESKDTKIPTITKESTLAEKLRIEDDTSSSSFSEKQSITIAKNNFGKGDIKKERNIKNVTSSTVTEPKPVSYVRKNILERCNTISIDFWENYDPDEICKSGFGLTSSEMFPMQAICFLCGSAGQETLLHCLICCEPYHTYCLEQMPVNFVEYNEKYNWLCPRCTTCEACGQADRQKINCMKCHKAYHPNCFNTLWKRDDKPTLCSNCLRCKSCGSNSIAKFVGNFALCHLCFKLRNKGNYCPLCQKCYDDNDFNTKMMECGKCKKWVHAKCETLADEQYQILSLLPESVEFLCNKCCNQSTPFWREAIQNELKSSFSNVLKLLSKNRVARNMLKLSPYKNNNPNNRTPTLGRKIQFQDDENLDANENKEPNYRFLNRRLSFESQDGIIDVRQESKSPISSTIVDIKKKLNSNEYISLQDFNTGMEHALEGAESEELLKIYRNILKEVFPWYDPTQKEEKEENMDLKKSTLETPPQIQSSLFDSIKLFDYDMGKEKGKVDNRICGLCKVVGDGLPHKEARLLYCGQNEWVHANCALWSSEVYEEIDGSLQNVHSALSRGRLIKCAHCKQKGASVGCCEKGCHETYHFACALKVNCYFLHDKTVYCHSHELTNKNLLTNPSDFDIRRSVYVELDRKRKKYSEPDKVHFMVGSLSVTSLGKIIPILSDDFDALVPLGFTCTRLFWSTSEPWKLIPYYISTSILNSEINNICVDRNFTVDHSLPKPVVDKKLKEILLWQRDLSKETVDLDFEDEPQNTADLLTPELTDAIFEELPHDFLDGISVQDVLMYEELLSMDFKSEINYNDSNLISNSDQIKNTKDNAEDVDSDSKNSRELKRSKSEVFNQFGNTDKLNKNKSHQRSCSLTWSCKLDNSLTPTIKKRKITSRDNNMYFQLLQVDGAYDSSSSECESPIHESEDMWSFESTEEPVTCERCQCTYRTRASYKRHLTTCDALSTSESDSEDQVVRSNMISSEAPMYVNVTEAGEPNVITSYESFSSYQATQNEVHSTIMNTQTLVTAEATSEVIAVPENTNVLYPTFQQQVLEQKTATLPVITHPSLTISDMSSIPINQSTITMSQPQPIEESTQMQGNQQQATFCINQQPICVNQSNTLSLNHAGLISLDNSSITLNQTNPISINPITINQNSALPINQMEIQQPVAIQSIPFTSEVTPLINIAPQNQITIDAKMLAAPCTNLVNSVVAQTMAVPQAPWVKPVVKSSVITQKAIRPRGKPRSLAAKRGRLTTGSTIIMPPSSNTTPVIVQHLPSSNMVPFVDAFQQQSGQNLQYVTTITPQINSTIAPQTQLVQIQPENNFLSLVPGVQPTMIIQQPRVVTDQLIVDGNGSMMWATQPVYYGFETIVQNTVMQSQQFLPTTMNGVLTTNSSYSATTQVFQTSKLEPMLDVSQGGFVLVNSGQIVNPQAIQAHPQISHSVHAQNLSNTHVPVVSRQHRAQARNQAEPVNSAAVINDIPTQTVQTKPATTLPTSVNNLHSITLPLAPFVPEQGIPTNIVTPTPKPPTSAQSRPMSRVLPMQTNLPREQKKEEKTVNEKPIECAKETAIITSFIKPKVTILENEIIKEANEIIREKVVTAKPESQIKLNLPKTAEKGNHNHISNNSFSPKSTLPIQVASLKPIVTEIKANIPVDPVPEDKPETPLPPPVTEEVVPFSIPEITRPPPSPCEQKLSQEKTPNVNNTNNFPKNGTSILYTVETRDGFRYSSTSIYELWSKVFETVQDARAAHNMPPLPANALDKINNLQLLGLKTNGLRYLLEQLPGASKCAKYKPSFHTRKPLDDSDDDMDVTSTSGSIRTVSYVRKKEPYDMFGWLASKHRKPENCVIDSDLLPRRGSITNLPMAMRFRQLKLTSKVSVGVYRSNIHRRGLFSLRDIESGEMVIEYAGEVTKQ